MNGPHDLGGQMGFGPIAPEPNEPVFHEDWERRALGVALAFERVRGWSGDANRHSRERLPPAQYLSKSYYDIWASALRNMVVDRGIATRAELESGHAAETGKPAARIVRAEDVSAIIARGAPYERPAQAAARFAVGDLVRTRVMHPTTHTRLPRYARGKLGVVESVRGAHSYPDSNAHGRGEDPQWLYTVRFNGAELWGEDADPALRVSIDAFEPYLDPT